MDEIVVHFNGRSESCWPRLVWQQMFNLYRKHGGDLDNMDDILIDYDTIKKMMAECIFDFRSSLKSFKIVWGFSYGLTDMYFNSTDNGCYPNKHVYLIECDERTVKITGPVGPV
jgi:hypothetical protein